MAWHNIQVFCIWRGTIYRCCAYGVAQYKGVVHMAWNNIQVSCIKPATLNRCSAYVLLNYTGVVRIACQVFMFVQYYKAYFVKY